MENVAVELVCANKVREECVVWALWLFRASNLYSQESSAIVTSANRKRERAAWIYVGKGGGEEIPYLKY